MFFIISIAVSGIHIGECGRVYLRDHEILKNVLYDNIIGIHVDFRRQFWNGEPESIPGFLDLHLVIGPKHDHLLVDQASSLRHVGVLVAHLFVGLRLQFVETVDDFLLGFYDMILDHLLHFLVGLIQSLL